MDTAAPLGIAMMPVLTNAKSAKTRKHETAVCLFRVFVFSCVSWFVPSGVHAGERYALIITGASGGEQYAQKYDAWRVAFTTTLRDKFHYAPDRTVVLAETASDGVQTSTREHVRKALTDLRARLTKDDQLLVLLIGHGTSIDGDEAKFNLVGPDLSASEWLDLIRQIPGRVVFVNTTAASFPFLRKLAGRGRVVVTATDSAAQQFETVFAEYFVKAFEDPAAN